MSIKNRIISLIMAFSFIPCAYVSAQEETAVIEEEIAITAPIYGERLYGKLMLLEGMGYFDDLNELDLSKEVTRGQLASWLALTAAKNEITPYKYTDFLDVKESHQFYNDIQNVVASGYMSGVGGERFKPEDSVKLIDAATAMVRLVGREAFATVQGGYPTGYEKTARNIGIYDSVDGKANCLNILLMIYNTLTANALVPSGIDGSNILHDNSKTVLEQYHNIYEIKGIMNANGYTKLSAEDHIKDINTIEIDSVLYHTDKDYNSMIGRVVRGFYRYDDVVDESFIVSLYDDKKDNDILVIDPEELKLDENLNLRYKISEEKYDDAKLVKGFDFVYNNRIVAKRANDEILIEDGELTLIDNNKDGTYDVVIARAVETMKTSAIDFLSNKIYADKAVLETEDYPYCVSIYKEKQEDGSFKEITIDEIKPDSVLSVFRSKDKMYLEVWVSNDTLFAPPTYMDDEIITVDEVEYEVLNDEIFEKLKLGITTEFLLDIYGRIAYIGSTTSEYQYGYLFKTFHDAENNIVSIKMVTALGEKRYDLTETIMLDGINKADPTLLVGRSKQMIRYRLNADKKIRAVDTLDTVTGDERNDSLSIDLPRQSMWYYHTSKTFLMEGKYRADSNSFMVVVPSDPNEQDDIELYTTSYDFAMETVEKHEFTIFDIDENDLTVGAYIYYPVENLADTETTLQSETGVFDKFYTTVEDGDVVKKVRLFNKGEYVEYVVEDKVTGLESYSFGDVFKYAINARGKIASVYRELDVDRESPNNINNLQAESSGNYYRYNFGRIKSKEKGYLIMISNLNNPYYEDKLDYLHTVPTSDLVECTLVDMTERKLVAVDPKYYSEYIQGGNSPSYIYARVYKNFRTLDMIIYKY